MLVTSLSYYNYDDDIRRINFDIGIGNNRGNNIDLSNVYITKIRLKSADLSDLIDLTGNACKV